MKRLIVLLIILLSFNGAAQAKFAQADTEQVPIHRVVTNLESRLKIANLPNEDKAMLEFQIGRLYSMAYANKTHEVSVFKDAKYDPLPGGTTMKPFYGYAVTDYKQFSVVAGDQKAEEHAKKNLAAAIQHLQKALQLNPELNQAKLGLAWCFDQQGEKAKAIPLYRDVLKTSWEQENPRGGLRGTSTVEETAGYLLKLLDPREDAAEIADVKRKQSEASKTHRAITPIVIPLKAGMGASDLMCETTVSFDLDGSGMKPYDAWPAREAGWLVYDGSGRGEITSGLQLFGQKTFWIFWRHGYEALSALDDNGDGVIDGAERQGLAIWQDENSNGVSEPGEVKTLAQCGIESLSCQNCVSERGFLFSKDGVRFSNGTSADTYDWIVETRF